MAFDQNTRNRLQRFVGDARRLLSDEFARQLRADHGMDPATGECADPDTLTGLDATGRETARLLRATLEHYAATSPGCSRADALQRIAREQAFTVLNRLAALRMAEGRGLLVESVAAGYQSKGFRLYAGLAGAALGETGDAYRCYLFSVFDELAVDLPALFDRFSPHGRLFPREAALLGLLGLINDPEIGPLWAEDETIGWVYQYFNSEKERKEMRDASQAPRNSRELAVRNQFFTPRYVVQFLTDNTLGRTWYEMTKGKTALVEACAYLVRRPAEVFLAEGEQAPPQDDGTELSQEELLRRPVYIPHRLLKDPRDITMLDPACGSMHFGLYAFDLFERIYEEAWELEEAGAALSRPEGLATLRESYESREAFLRDVPRLIVERNIHGIDIDARAVQIAGLSLWLRAQKSWHERGLKPAERPRIRRSNVVCAEPMPGGKGLLEGFLGTLKQDRLETLIRRVMKVPEGTRVRATANMSDRLCDLVRVVWDRMQLAGEAGSLLKIEEELQEGIRKGQEEWEERHPLFRVTEFSLDEEPRERYYRLVPGDVEGQRVGFWDMAEGLVLAALRDYAEAAVAEEWTRRRLFVEDAVRGLGFVDLCRRRYDVVLMNPPFGKPVAGAALLPSEAASNLYPAFVLRGTHLASSFVGVISDRTFVVQQSFDEFRSAITGPDWGIDALVDLGWGVLDDADVQVAMYYLATGAQRTHLFAKLEADNCSHLAELVTGIGWRGMSDKVLANMPARMFAYTLPPIYFRLLQSSRPLRAIATLPRGLGSNDASRTYKAWYEVPQGSIGDGKTYRSLSNGGPPSPFFRDETAVAEWLRRDGKLLVEEGYSEDNRAYDQKKYDDYFIAGLAFPKQSTVFNVAALPADTIPTREGKAVIPTDTRWRLPLLAFLNSSIARYFVAATNGLHKQSGPVGMTPIPELPPSLNQQLGGLASAAYCLLASRSRHDEASRYFYQPFPFWEECPSVAAQVQPLISKIDTLLFEALSVPADERAVIETAQLPEVSYFSPSAADWVSYAVGVVWGRWDARHCRSGQAEGLHLDSFAPLPTFPPGTLNDARGAPLAGSECRHLQEQAKWSYRIEIVWSGILVDDPGHSHDVEAQVSHTFREIFLHGPTLESDLYRRLGTDTLRDYLRRPSALFTHHLKQYSKSRRQAPIYWPLSTPSLSYTVWLYYHRLSDQTLFTCVNDFVEPKLKQVAADAARLRQKSGRSAAEEKELERLADFEQELTDFRAELLRLAPVWKPDLNDGVQITAAPLWRLFQHRDWQKKLKKTWEELEAGKYDWAHLAYSLWPDRVREKCKSDRSLAIAHGLEHLYVEPTTRPTRKGRRKPPEEVADED